MLRFPAILFCVLSVAAQTVDHPEEFYKKAVELQQQGKLEQAIADYRRLLVQYPQLIPVRANLGAALAGLGEYSAAIAEYQRVLATNSSVLDLNQVRLNLALAYYKQGDYAPAIKALESVHSSTPSNKQAVLLLGDCYLRTGNDKKVVELLVPVQQQDPADEAVIYMLGTALVRDGQTEKGQVLVDQILKHGDFAEARLLIGTTKFSVHDFAGALPDLQRAAELNPDLPDVFSYYGMALLSTGDQEGAKKAFQKELERDANNFEANLRLGVLLRQDEDYTGAMKYFTHALQLRPGDYGVRYQIASAELALDHVEASEKELESLVNEAPSFVEAHVSLATIYYRQKRKADGDKQRALVAQLNAAQQANQPAQKQAQ